MKFKKGSKEAKAYMAKLRAARGKKTTAKKTVKKVGSTSKIAPNLLMELWFAVHSKESNKYNTIAKKLDNEGVSFSIQNAVSSDATEMRYKKNIDTFEVANRIQKIMQKTTHKKVGSTLKLDKKEMRLGMKPKTRSKSGNGYHKNTKSKNVNIRVISGFSKFVKHKGFTIDVIKLASGKNEYAVYQVSPVTNKEVYYGSYLTLKAAKEWINRSLYLLKNASK
jgi:hypothetical protein